MMNATEIIAAIEALPKAERRALEGWLLNGQQELAPETEFLNVDLRIRSKADLAPLEEELSSELSVHLSRRVGRAFELSLGGPYVKKKSAGNVIRHYAKLLSKLGRPQKKLWKEATIREFDIGFQSGVNPYDAEFILDREMIQELARQNAQLKITIYSPAVIRMSQSSPEADSTAP